MFPNNPSSAAPLVAPIFLALHHIRAAVSIDCNNTRDKAVVIACALVEMRRQKTNLARHHAVEDEVDGDDVLLTTVAEDHLLPHKSHLRLLRDLHSTARVAGTSAAPVVRRSPDDINKCADQPLDHDTSRYLTTKTRNLGTDPQNRWPLSNGLFDEISGSLAHRGKTLLLATLPANALLLTT